MDEHTIRKEICAIGQRLYAARLINGVFGNISFRLEKNVILATPTMVHKGFMQPDDIVIIDTEGTPKNKHERVTSEIKMHLEIYRLRDDVKAVVHAHPPHVTAFSLTGSKESRLPRYILPEIEILFGEIPIAGYATSGTFEVVDALKPHIPSGNAIIMAHHGAVTMGATLEEACNAMETLEHFCEVLHIVGYPRRTPHPLTREQVSKLPAKKSSKTV